jgi:hypothetical protein
VATGRQPSDAQHSRREPGNKRECCNPGEGSYESTLVLLLLGLDDPVETLLNSLSVLDHWLEKNGSQLKDEVRVRRIKHWKRGVLEQLNVPRI